MCDKIASGVAKSRPNPLGLANPSHSESTTNSSMLPSQPSDCPKSLPNLKVSTAPVIPPPEAPPKFTNDLSALPLHVSVQTWTDAQVCEWLTRDKRFNRYVHLFSERKITGKAVLHMCNHQLLRNLGITDDTDRAILLKRLNELQAANSKIQKEISKRSSLPDAFQTVCSCEDAGRAKDNSPNQTSFLRLSGLSKATPPDLAQQIPRELEARVVPKYAACAGSLNKPVQLDSNTLPPIPPRLDQNAYNFNPSRLAHKLPSEDIDRSSAPLSQSPRTHSSQIKCTNLSAMEGKATTQSSRPDPKDAPVSVFQQLDNHKKVSLSHNIHCKNPGEAASQQPSRSGIVDANRPYSHGRRSAP